MSTKTAATLKAGDRYRVHGEAFTVTENHACLNGERKIRSIQPCPEGPPLQFLNYMDPRARVDLA